ncbi:efflux transporter outer membrane subunit [bacterium]|nr:efflux transporter outer membrane subunit [bacterium]
MKSARITSLFLTALATVALTACSLAPKYERPDAPVPDQWPAGAAYDEYTTPTIEAPDISWREYFVDDNMCQVIEMALENNRDLQIAALNVEQMRGLYGIKQRELLPTVSAAGTMSKQRLSGDLVGVGAPRNVNQYSVDLGILSWELDFFGRLRSLKDEGLQEFLASEHARKSTEILLTSSVAQTYLAMATDLENLQLARETLETQEHALRIVQRQFDAGVATELDLYRAKTPVDSARKDLASYAQMIAQDRNALEFLVGAPVPDSLLPDSLEGVAAPKALEPGLNSEVLLRRPDVLQAEASLKGSYANIGAARAAFFPRISLTTTLGTASNDLNRLFEQGTETWSFVPNIVMPIFDARTWSALKVSKSQQKIAVVQYERAIQNAFREVADALAVRGTIDEQIAAQENVVESVEHTHRLATLRYEKGLDNYLGVLDAQRSLYAAEQGLLALRYAKVANQVSLFSVLGGGADIADTAVVAQK